MCGIVGVISLKRDHSPDDLAQIVIDMRDRLSHRGPDAAGVWVSPTGDCALGHRRLSIIDLSEDARQPMGAEGCRAIVTYNGEIYNFERLKARLVARGRRFKSRSDTEILPHLFDDLDPAPLAELSAMFALAVWRPDLRSLLLARDAFGEKPLYVYEDARWFAFASEIQAFYGLPGFDAAIEPSALSDYLLLGYAPGPSTIYKRVRMIEPGSYEVADFSSGAPAFRRGRYFSFAAAERPHLAAVDYAAVRARLKDRIIQSVAEKLVSDVPLGAFLSGGVDSSLVVAVARRELGRPIKTFSIGFEGAEESEHEAAREIAAHLGADHHEQVLRPDGLSLIATIAAGLDQPLGDSSCLPTYLLSAFARRHVTVALSGDGGDELFGGYGRYRDSLREVGGGATRLSDAYLSPRWLIWSPAEAAKFFGGALPAPTETRLTLWRRQLDDASSPAICRMRTIDANVYMPGCVLPKVDRMSMQHSLEVRAPFLDVPLAEIAMGLSADACFLPPDGTKRILKDIASEYLPAAWMNRPKRGFGLPANAWGMQDVIGMSRDLIVGPDAKVAEHFDRRALADMVDLQRRPGQFSIYQMWPLLVLELWLRGQREKATAGPVSRAA